MDTNWIAQFVMYSVFLFSLIAYATLDGFDLGVGCLHLFTNTDYERRLMINAIGPVWDGNTTWIVIGAGTLFAAFPKAFSIITPNFYTPFMWIIFGFMLRAASIEFRGKHNSNQWRQWWDRGFFLASLILAFTVGMILGNLIKGVPLNDQGEVVGGMTVFLGLYPVLIALFGISCFMMHGSLYLLMKIEGPFHDKVRKWTYRTIAGFIVFWVIITLVTYWEYPYMMRPFLDMPIMNIFPLLSFSSIAGIIIAIRKKRDGWAFVFSCLSIFFLMLLFVIGTYPYIVYSYIDPMENSLSFMNSSVSEKALWILVGVTLTGIPLSFFYFPYIYRVFRGKVKIDTMSY